MALAALGLISSVQAQVQVAGTLLVNVDATTATAGTVTSITNSGTLGGYFEARGGGTTVPAAANVHGNGTSALLFNGGQYLQLVPELGAAPTVPPEGVVGANPTYSVEAWVMNPIIQQEETIVSWGRRGDPVGSNSSFNYGWDGAFGAMGHWGGADMGWDSATAASGTYPPRVPAPGVWNHLVYTYDGATQRVYANGVEQNSEAVTINIVPNTSIVLAAQIEPDGTTITTGLRGSLSIGRLRIHDEALTAEQIANNFSFEAANFSNGGAPLPAGPTHRYSFNSSAGAAPSGTVVPESISGANGVVRGAGAALTGSRLTLPGGPSATQAYVDLPNGLLSNNSTNKGGQGEVTIEGWFKRTGAHNWSRIFDFGSSDIGGGVGGEVTDAGGGGEGRDYLFWSAQNAGDLNNQQVAWRNFDPVDPGAGLQSGAVDHYTASAVSFPKDIHFALTWREAAGLIEFYENGTLIGTMTMPIAMSDINDVNVWLGRSNWAGDANTQGEYDEFRIYNRVLAPENIQASYQAGPRSLATTDPLSFSVHPQNRTVSELTSASFYAEANGAPPVTITWYKDDVLIAGAVGNTVTLQNVLTADNGAEIYAVASNFVSGSSIVVTSSVAILTVGGDSIAPTITAARADSTELVQVVFSESVNPADLTTANFTLTGPAGSPTVVSVAPGSTGNRALLTLSGPIVTGYYTITVSNVRDVSTSQNPIVAGSTISFWQLIPDGLAHRYTFNNQPAANATDATVPDTIGTADAVVKNGTGTTTFTGERITLSGGSQAVAPYVDLPNGMLSLRSTNNGGSGQITLEGWARVTGNQSWARIYDFGSSGVLGSPGLELLGPGGSGEGIDYMFLSAQNGGNTAVRRIDITNRDQSDHGTAGRDFGTTTFGQDFHFAVTWDEATGQVVMYENGVEVIRYETVAAMSEINDVNVWLGRSNWTADNNLQGEFDEFRVYDRVLNSGEVALNKASGPDGGLGLAQSLDLVLTNVSYYTNITRPVPVLVGFSNGGTQNVASLSSVVYTTTAPTVAEITPDGILHTYGVGSAMITATFNGLTDSAEVVVTGDNTPPTILSARAEGPQHVLVIFSEPVSEASGTEPFAYFIETSAGTIDAEEAVRIGDNTRVLLTLSSPMPAEYITVRSEWVADLLGNTTGDNGTAGFLNFVPTSLRHRYTFNNGTNNLAANMTVRDAVGGADATVIGAPTVFTGERIALFGGTPNTAGYVDLPNGLLSVNSTNNGGSGQVTFETWVQVNGAQNWSRIFDFGSTGPCCGTGGEITGTGGSGEGIDYLMLSAAVEANATRRRLELNNRDENGNAGAGFVDYDTSTFQQMAHVVLTWDEPTGVLRVYENGTQTATMTRPLAMSAINDVNVWLGRSTWTGDQNLQGEFDEFRVYNRVLTAAELAVNIAAGPDNNYGEPLALNVELPAILNVGQVYPLNVMGDFANVSNVNLSLAGLAAITSSNPSVVSNTPSGLLARSFGTATLQAVFSGITNTISLVVSNDTPLAGDDGITTQKDVAATVSTATLLANDAAPHGGPLTFTAVSATSTNGGTVTFAAPNITYTPVAGYTGPDLFTYTVSDGFGVMATGNVYVFVVDGALPEENHVGIAASASGDSYTVTFNGTPGVTYRIQRATDITGPWTTISTQTANPTGLISLTDGNPPADQAFYRVVTP